MIGPFAWSSTEGGATVPELRAGDDSVVAHRRIAPALLAADADAELRVAGVSFVGVMTVGATDRGVHAQAAVEVELSPEFDLRSRKRGLRRVPGCWRRPPRAPGGVRRRVPHGWPGRPTTQRSQRSVRAPSPGIPEVKSAAPKTTVSAEETEAKGGKAGGPGECCQDSHLRRLLVRVGRCRGGVSTSSIIVDPASSTRARSTAPMRRFFAAFTF